MKVDVCEGRHVFEYMYEFEHVSTHMHVRASVLCFVLQYCFTWATVLFGVVYFFFGVVLLMALCCQWCCSDGGIVLTLVLLS